jgi:hypothetical protein
MNLDDFKSDQPARLPVGRRRQAPRKPRRRSLESIEYPAHEVSGLAATAADGEHEARKLRAGGGLCDYLGHDAPSSSARMTLDT